jgi:membrane-anchored glycerophosphoryl diester phosphodiesterase (GDPDase)
MAEETVTEDRVNWRHSLYTAVGALLVFFLLVMWNADAVILYLLVVIPVTSIFLIIYVTDAKGRNRLFALSTLAVFGALSWILVHHSFEIRATGRWLLLSRIYKARVLTQPDPSNGEFKHIEWDGWGFIFAETNVYLVFDSNNVLSQEIQRQSSGKFSGIPCEIWKLHRLEGQWYYAVFYTDARWESCA